MKVVPSNATTPAGSNDHPARKTRSYREFADRLVDALNSAPHKYIKTSKEGRVRSLGVHSAKAILREALQSCHSVRPDGLDRLQEFLSASPTIPLVFERQILGVLADGLTKFTRDVFDVFRLNCGAIMPPELGCVTIALAYLRLSSAEKPEARDKLCEEFGIRSMDDAKHALLLIEFHQEAKGRVLAGESCVSIADCFNVDRDSMPMYDLQVYAAVKGPAKECAKAGEPCDSVAERFGFRTNVRAMDLLCMVAVKKWGAHLVHKYGTCLKAAESEGIPLHGEAMRRLHMIMLTTLGVRQLEEYKSCDKIAERHGISRSSLAREYLHMLAAIGPAAELVLNGMPCTQAAQKLGIARDDRRAMNFLYMVAAKGPAGEWLRKHKSSWKLAANKFDIPFDGDAYQPPVEELRKIEADLRAGESRPWWQWGAVNQMVPFDYRV